MEESPGQLSDRLMLHGRSPPKVGVAKPREERPGAEVTSWFLTLEPTQPRATTALSMRSQSTPSQLEQQEGSPHPHHKQPTYSELSRAYSITWQRKVYPSLGLETSRWACQRVGTVTAQSNGFCLCRSATALAPLLHFIPLRQRGGLISGQG